MEAEARYANAEVEVARSRAAINRIASLETDLQRALAAKESSDEKHHAQLRAVTSEAEHRNAKLESELKFTAKQLERKREKKRAHKAQAVELAHKLKHAVSIAKDTARDAEKAIAQAKAEAAQNATGAVARSKETAERNAATAAASAANAAQLSDALERKRRKKKAYKSQLEDATAKTAESREEAKRAKTALANARALAEADHAVAEAALSRAAAEHEAEKEALTNRVRELESALRHAARDYKRVVAESEPTKQALGVSEHTAEQIRVENLGLAAGLKQAEDACRVFERQAAEARAALAAAEKDFAKQLEANRRARVGAGVAGEVSRIGSLRGTGRGRTSAAREEERDGKGKSRPRGDRRRVALRGEGTHAVADAARGDDVGTPRTRGAAGPEQVRAETEGSRLRHATGFFRFRTTRVMRRHGARSRVVRGRNALGEGVESSLKMCIKRGSACPWSCT